MCMTFVVTNYNITESVEVPVYIGGAYILHTNTVNTRYSTTIHFQRIWWINEFGRITGYSLVLVHYIGTGKLWQIKRFGG